MKKRLLTLALCGVMALSLAACGGNSGSNPPAGGGSSGDGNSSAASGSVYYLNFKPEQDGDWQKGTFMAGQVAGLVNSCRPCREIVANMTADAAERLSALAARFGNGV